MSASDEVWILGIQMTKFGKHPDLDSVDLAAQAATGALSDAGVTMADIGVLAAGNLMNASASIGQQLQKQIGQTGIPVYNVANACATGATALRTAIMAVKAGEVDYGLAVGVEKLSGAGLLGGAARRRRTPIRGLRRAATARSPPIDGRIGTETMPGVFAQIGMEYGHKYGGTSFELFAKISEKNHAHSTLNPLASYQKRFTLDQIMNDVMIAYPNTRPMCSANCDGAAAAVVCNGETLKSLSLEQRRRAVKVSASVLTTDPYEEGCQVLPNVNTLTRKAAAIAYEQSGVGPSDLDLVELHDCFATAELVHYDNLMLCEEGRSRRLLQFRRHMAGRLDTGERVGRAGVEGSPHRGHRHRQHLGGLPPPARRGGRPPDRECESWPCPRHRTGFRLRRPYSGEISRLAPTASLLRTRSSCQLVS